MNLWILNPKDYLKVHKLKQISPKFYDDDDQEKDERGNIMKFMILK